ncbi:MAG: hypothetical protein M3Z01_03095 [Thermoproteota archaeon]|nr:hypothetical protein [Thermoproteota archaeon]
MEFEKVKGSTLVKNLTNTSRTGKIKLSIIMTKLIFLNFVNYKTTGKKSIIKSAMVCLDITI